eukprot:snap_masked-scaffold_22-processed-gene-2.26-mRNA-1 protein AED:1.00 eAED:1.00 QI:0/0/0/0/1/1/2/0/285
METNQNIFRNTNYSYWNYVEAKTGEINHRTDKKKDKVCNPWKKTQRSIVLTKVNQSEIKFPHGGDTNTLNKLEFKPNVSLKNQVLDDKIFVNKDYSVDDLIKEIRFQVSTKDPHEIRRVALNECKNIYHKTSLHDLACQSHMYKNNESLRKFLKKYPRKELFFSSPDFQRDRLFIPRLDLDGVYVKEVKHRVLAFLKLIYKVKICEICVGVGKSSNDFKALAGKKMNGVRAEVFKIIKDLHSVSEFNQKLIKNHRFGNNGLISLKINLNYCGNFKMKEEKTLISN